MRLRRTLAQYTKLFRNPFALFGPGPDDRGVATILYPNGAREIWLRTADGGHSVCLMASHGPAGMGINIRAHTGTLPLTVRLYNDEHAQVGLTARGVQELELTCYDDTPRAQAFSRWYDHAETPEDIALLGPEYARPEVPR